MGGAVAAIDYMKAALVAANSRPPRPDRGRRHRGRRRQPLHRGRALAADRRRRRHPASSTRRSRPSRSRASPPGARAATPPPSRRRWPTSAPPPPPARTSCRPRSPPRRPASPPASGARRCARSSASTAPRPASARRRPRRAGNLAEVRAAVEATSARIGRRIKFLVGKPGLDGHSNGAEQIAVRARDSGMEVVYEGIRLTPAQIVNAALEEVGPRRRPVDPLRLAPAAGRRSACSGCARPASSDIPVVVGGIIPDADAETLRAAGRRPRLHAQGLRAQPHHARHRRARGRGTPARRPELS